MNPNSAKHFLECARRGAHPAASGGEQRFNRLAKALKKHMDDLSGLDGDAMQGFCTLATAAGSGGYGAVETLLRGVR